MSLWEVPSVQPWRRRARRPPLTQNSRAPTNPSLWAMIQPPTHWIMMRHIKKWLVTPETNTVIPLGQGCLALLFHPAQGSFTARNAAVHLNGSSLPINTLLPCALLSGFVNNSDKFNTLIMIYCSNHWQSLNQEAWKMLLWSKYTSYSYILTELMHRWVTDLCFVRWCPKDSNLSISSPNFFFWPPLPQHLVYVLW